MTPYPFLHIPFMIPLIWGGGYFPKRKLYDLRQWSDHILGCLWEAQKK